MKKLCMFLGIILVSMNCSMTYLQAIQAKQVEPIKEVPKPVEVKLYEIKSYYDIPLDKDLQDYIREECEAVGVDMELVLAVMQIESDFQSDIISETDDHGLMQINSCNHEELQNKLGIDDFLDPYDSAKAGIYMLSRLTWCENETQMLMCYNMGTTGAKRYWNDGIYESSYSRKVLQAKEEIGGKRYEVKLLCD